MANKARGLNDRPNPSPGIFPMGGLQSGDPRPAKPQMQRGGARVNSTPKRPGAPKAPSRPFGPNGPGVAQTHGSGPRSTSGGKAPASRGALQPKPAPVPMQRGPRQGGARSKR
jgi:hypothetical protein